MSIPDPYLVVRNDEEQYSIWPVGRPLPAGWYPQGEPASEQQCLDRIAAEWTDMRPRSLRPADTGGAGAPDTGGPDTGGSGTEPTG